MFGKQRYLKLHPDQWYKDRDRRGPGKNMRKQQRRNRLQRLLRFSWALRKIMAASVLWRRLEMRPGLDAQVP